MLWDELEATLKALPTYFGHSVEQCYEDGTTYRVSVWLTSGAGLDVKTYIVRTQLTDAGREVVGYKAIL